MVRELTITLLLLTSLLSWVPAAFAQAQGDYVIRAQDVLEITIWNQANLRTKYTVEPDGAMTFPFIGRVKAEGLTPFQLEAELKKQLSPEYFKNPQVTVRVEQYRAGRVFIFGGVGSSGPLPLTPNMTLIEALAKAGYGTASEAVIVRAAPGSDPEARAAKAAASANSSGATDAPEEDGGEVIRVNLREFEKDVQSGQLTRNILLRDGDYIYVPRTDPNRIFITGEVRTPGAFSIPAGTTVLQALTLAGGVTENASMGRITIVRIVDGKKKNIKAKPDTLVEFGDTIIVRERFF